MIELLQTTNDTKTLGSPKVLVLNQQEATVHVGEDLGYQTTVTSELQSTQAPQFLQVGVLLDITPRITRDNRVLLHVRPEVSTGAIDPITQVPNKKTTELETDVMLNDGEGDGHRRPDRRTGRSPANRRFRTWATCGGSASCSASRK